VIAQKGSLLRRVCSVSAALNPIIGVALGAASGALGGALTDYGMNDAFMKELAAKLQPGNAALFVLIQEMTAQGAEGNPGCRRNRP
jgi:uncharacterized membrane protein